MKPGTRSIATFAAGLFCGLLFHWLPAPSASAFDQRDNIAREAAGGDSSRTRGSIAGGAACPSDIAPPGGDGQVSVLDLLQVINDWGLCPNDPDQDNDGWTVGEGDCDDNNPNVYPGAPESCNGVDDDCDNQIDEDAVPDASEPNDVCTQQTYIGFIFGDNCSGESLAFSGNLVPAGDVDFLRFTLLEQSVVPQDLIARIALTVPADAAGPLQLCVRCSTCGAVPTCISVGPGQTDSLRVRVPDTSGQNEAEIIVEVKQSAPATGLCQPYQIMVTCNPGAVSLTCGP